MDQAIRNRLRSVVTQCRRMLEESVAQQLQGRYDIYATGKKDEVRAEKDVPLDHLSDEEREARRDILAHFEHVSALGYRPKEALEQLIREIAFTHLNRLCAYKMMEVRDVYVAGQRFREAVSKGLKSQGFLFYLADHPEDEQLFNAGRQEEAYRHFLNWLGGTLSQEIGVLFSPTDPANRVYPPQRVLDDVLDLLNSEELKGIWSEDETIGWVYQYFTPKELRDQARKESQAPRNSYELAFRNQFFTPRYVVEFLTDNTLGRIWYEMRRGNTRLKDECRYMVRRPGEVFFSDKEDEPGSPVRAMKDMLLGGTEETFPPFRARETQRLVELAHTVDGYERHPFEDQVEEDWWPWAKLREILEAGELSRFPAQDLLDVLFCQARADRHGGGYGDWDEIFYDIANEVRRRAIDGRKEDASQEQLLRAITAVVHRAMKDPREIKILDPACGSGHFLLYCFALLLVIYEEAYDDPELGPGLQRDYPTKDDLRRAVPGLILRHNLHGIDIDLRCTQIAALALWLRCQRAYQEMGLKKDRPRITKSNIVCAEPMPGEGHMLKEFVAEIQPKLLGQLVEVVFDKMKLAGEAGSLIKIEEEIRDAVAEARRQWRIGPIATQMGLFSDPKPVVRQQQFDLSGITEAQFFEQAEASVVNALRSYSEQAQNGQRLQRRLFAEDAVRGFAFVDVCHKRFDVVLMNPPFGDPSTRSNEALQASYLASKHDVASAFIERGTELTTNDGRIGAITTRTLFFLSYLSEWREEVLLRRSRVSEFLDLGQGVLEAFVETAAYIVTRRANTPSMTTFAKCAARVGIEGDIESLLKSIAIGSPRRDVFFCDDSTFKYIPRSPFAYWVSDRIRSVFRNLPQFETGGRRGYIGALSQDDLRFLRAWWEVGSSCVGRGWTGNTSKNWVPYAKGGSHSPFYSDIGLLIKWANDGEEIKRYVSSYRKSKGFSEQWTSQLNAYDKYFKPGITWSSRPHEQGSFWILPSGCIFGNSGPCIQDERSEDLIWLLAVLNSRTYRAFLDLLMPRGSSGGQTLKYELGYVRSVPIPSPSAEQRKLLTARVLHMTHLLRRTDSFDETSQLFTWPFPASFSFSFNTDSPGLLGAYRQFCQVVDQARHDYIEDGEVIDNEVLAMYGLSPSECEELYSSGAALSISSNAARHELLASVSLEAWTKSTISWMIGVAVSRWLLHPDSQVTIACERPDEVFAPIPLVPPASCLEEPSAIVDGDKEAEFIVQNGILVDDPDHSDDIIRRVRVLLEITWRDRADAIEKEACEILGVGELRDYFRRPGAGGFWDDHIKRYSKSRRKAPIYWLLQSSKKNYALWIYYHRLDKDILFKALLNYVEPKIRREEARLDELRSQKAALGPAAKGAKKFDKDIDRQEAFLSELRDFEDRLRRAANLHLDPDLNDGVVLNIAPLHELVPWKEAKSYWNDLMDGKYEWSSIAKQLREKGLVP